MNTRERHVSKPEAAAVRRAEAAETAASRDRTEAGRLARELADVREDRDRWRAQAERLAGALDRLKAPVADRLNSQPVVQTAAEPSSGPDTLYGVKAIAEYLGITANQAKHRVAQGLIPTFRMGGTICALRSTVDAAMAAAAQEGR